MPNRDLWRHKILSVLLNLFILLTCQLIADAADLPFECKSKNYHVYTDVDKQLAKKICDYMEKILPEYKNFSTQKNKHGIFLVKIFKKRKDYNEYIKKSHGESRYKTTFTYYHYAINSPKNEVTGFLLPDISLFQQLRHEGFHQYLHSQINQPPRWFDEGMGTLFEAARLDDKSKLINHVHIGMLRRLREGIFNFDKGSLNSKYKHKLLVDVVKLSHKEWAGQTEVNYAESWGLCYFFYTSENKNYKKYFKDYISSFKSTASQEENINQAFKKGFGKIDFDKLEDEFKKFIEDLTPPGWDEFLKGKNFYNSGDYKKAIEKLTEAIEKDDENFMYYYYRALSFYDQNDLEDAEKDFTRTLEIFPEDTPSIVFLGKIYVKNEQFDKAEELLSPALEFVKDERGKKEIEELLKQTGEKRK